MYAICAVLALKRANPTQIQPEPQRFRLQAYGLGSRFFQVQHRVAVLECGWIHSFTYIATCCAHLVGFVVSARAARSGRRPSSIVLTPPSRSGLASLDSLGIDRRTSLAQVTPRLGRPTRGHQSVDLPGARSREMTSSNDDGVPKIVAFRAREPILRIDPPIDRTRWARRASGLAGRSRRHCRRCRRRRGTGRGLVPPRRRRQGRCSPRQRHS